MLIPKRKLVYFAIDDTVYTVMESAAGCGEGVPSSIQLYVVLSEDAHGSTSVNVMHKEQVLSLVPDIEEYQKTLIQNSINEL